MSDLTIVTCTYKRDPALLAHTLATWRNQTVPIEIVIVDLNNDELAEEIEALCDDIGYIHAPTCIFNISHACNIGIRNSPETEYVLCAGAEVMFSENYAETVIERMCRECWGMGVCGTLPKGIEVSDDPHSEWSYLIDSCLPHSYRQVSPGTILCAARDWWFKVQGIDERQHFAWMDSECVRRAMLDKLRKVMIKWDMAQAVHQWHPPSSLVHTSPGRWIDEIRADMTIVRNDENWGTYKG